MSFHYLAGNTAMYVFHYEMPLDAALVISQVVAGDMALHWPRGNKKKCRIDFFCRSSADARRRLSEIRRILGDGDQRHRPPVTAVKPLKKKDWVQSCRKQFHARRVSGRIIVRPSWEKRSGGKNDCIIELDPGMAFGTGEHETTRACLRLIDEFQQKCPGGSFLDAGCGSGILAVAAAKLGFKPVDAIDNDPTAVRTARINFARNKVAGMVACRNGDILHFKPAHKYSLIAANLFANLLVRSSRRLAGLLELKSTSRLIISGVLVNQYDQVARAFSKQNLRALKKIIKNGWVTAVFAWRPGKIH